MGKPHIKLYVDCVSPFGYMGYWMVRNSPIFKSVDVEYIPILLGGLMKTCGNTAPLYIKNKDKWIERERRGWAKQFNVPMRDAVPPGFPIPTINVQRLLAMIKHQAPEKLPLALDTLYAAFWAPHTLPPSTPKPKSGEEYNINSADDVTSLLSPDNILGAQLTAEVLDKVSSPEAKKLLSANTEAAYADGAFGLPWFHCTNSQGETVGFWGFDHLGQVVRFLGLEDLDRVGGGKALRPLL